MSLRDLMIANLSEQFEDALTMDYESLHRALLDVDVIAEDDTLTMGFINEKLREIPDEAFLNAYNFFVEFQG